jgi:S1-C subfamily serine protease
MAVSAENIGFAIPVNTVKRVFHETLLSTENLASAWIGLHVTEKNGELLVTDVMPMSPADRAGVQPGDRLVSAAGRDVTNGIDYARQMLQAVPGQGFPLQLQRRGRSVRAEPVPLSSDNHELVRRIGVEVTSIGFDENPSLVRAATQKLYGGYSRRAPMLSGVVQVRRVYPDSSAARLGIEAGDVLLSFSYRDPWGDWREAPFVSERDLADKIRIQAGRSLQILVMRGDRLLDGTLKISP